MTDEKKARVAAPTYGLNADRSRLQMVVSEELEAGAKREFTLLQLDAKNVDELLKRLASLRAKMVDQHPTRLDGTVEVRPVRNMTWEDRMNALTGALVLCFRHPGFGWLHFELPKQDEARLERILRARASRKTSVVHRPN